MFETLPATRATLPHGRRRALTIAVAAHAFGLSLFAAVALFAVEPIAPPVTFPIVFVPPSRPPAAGPKLPKATHRPPKPAVKKTVSPPKKAPPVVQPTEVDEPADPIEPTQEPTLVADLDLPIDPDLDGTLDASGAGGDGVDGGIGFDEGGDDPDGWGTGPSEPAVHTVGGNVIAPRIIKKVVPRYPMKAKATRVQGEVVAVAVINEHGVVVDAQIESGHAFLRDAALDAMLQWRFVPGTLNGNAVPVYFTLRVNFRLR